VVGLVCHSLPAVQSWHQSVAELGEFSVLGLIAVGTGLVIPATGVPKCPVAARHFPDRTTVEKAIAGSMVSQLEAEAEKHESLATAERVAHSVLN